MKTVIFANGDLPDPESAKTLVSKGDLIIAANGGSVHCKNLSITPKVIIGDLDSIPKSLFDKWIEHKIKILQHETDKDQTDLELALQFALKVNSEDVLILGGLGGRWDHSFANILLASKNNFQQLSISFYSNGDWFHVVTDKLEIEGAPDQTISILPLGGDAVGVSAIGLKWELDNEDIPHGSSRGVSNLFKSTKSIISVKDGVLLVIKNKIQ